MRNRNTEQRQLFPCSAHQTVQQQQQLATERGATSKSLKAVQSTTAVYKSDQSRLQQQQKYGRFGKDTVTEATTTMRATILDKTRQVEPAIMAAATYMGQKSKIPADTAYRTEQDLAVTAAPEETAAAAENSIVEAEIHKVTTVTAAETAAV
jgi:hypothetical protein